MAYAAVASASQTIDLVLNYYQYSISPRFKDQISALRKHACSLQSFIEGSSDRVNNWEETIRQVTSKAEDIIELLLSDSLLESTVGSESKFKKRKYEYQLPYGFDELQRVTEEIELIANRVMGRHAEATDDFDDQLTEIIFRLLGGSSALETIAIVGIGGIGKTTLARNAYNNPLIVGHFDLSAWSTVSTRYVRRAIISDLLLAMNAESLTNSEDALITSVQKILRGKRYLIVLDDVSLRTLDALDELKSVLPDNQNGSRIILTTRLLDLGEDATHIHEMCSLDMDATWNLFREKIFKGDPCPSQLEYVGKSIAKRCRGHPLSIEMVTGVLVSYQSDAAWEDVLENMKILASEDGDNLVQILSISYIYLPHHLRPCFLYLGIFPYQKDIHVSKLIKQWVAEGFLDQTECKSFEERGEERVEDLVQRGLVWASKRKSNGRIKSIAIHDLIRDLCQRQAQKENFIIPFERFHPTNLQKCRRVSNLTYGTDIVEGVYDSAIRTIMLYGDEDQLGIRCSVGNVRLLRILDLSNAYNYDLPEEVFELFHLRYLAFECWFSISKAISNLSNLQTLIICSKKSGRMFDKLPEGIWMMLQLRHLLMFRLELPEQKGATSTLGNLQTLSRVVDFVCSRENLKTIPNVKKLALLYTDDLRDVVQAYELYNLKYLHKLEILKLEIMDWPSVEQHKMSCVFPVTLKKLNLCGLKLPWKHMETVASLPNLEVLKLRKHACFGHGWETSEGGFPQLTFLLIERSDLVHWITRSSHFPKLKCLVLRCCLRLLEVPHDIGEIPTLESIELDEQNESLWRSAKQIEEDRPSLGYYPLHIRVV